MWHGKIENVRSITIAIREQRGTDFVFGRRQLPDAPEIRSSVSDERGRVQHSSKMIGGSQELSIRGK
jgi:hypothetical protein